MRKPQCDSMLFRQTVTRRPRSPKLVARCVFDYSAALVESKEQHEPDHSLVTMAL